MKRGKASTSLFRMGAQLGGMLEHWTLRTLLALGLGLIALLVSVSSFIVVAAASSTKAEVGTIAAHSLPKSNAAYEVSIEVNAIALALRDAVLVEMQEDLPVEVERLQTSYKRINALMQALDGLVSSPQEKESLLDVRRSAARFDALGKAYVRHLEGGERGPARGMLTGTLRQAQHDYLSALQSFRLIQKDQAQAQAAHAASGMQRLQHRSVAAFASILMVGLAVGLALMHMLSRRLGAEPRVVAQAMSEVAQGRLDAALPSADFPGSVVGSLGAMVGQLRDAVREVRAGAEAVSHHSVGIAEEGRHLSTRTEQQAADLQEASATLEQFAAAMGQNETSVAEADRLASDATEVCERSQRTIDDAVAAMERVDESSRKISEITAVIDSLAFQTNILALNAAVEAARAGEHGRGFGVVASEVRKLSLDSAQSARDIRDLIASSGEQVRAGQALVGQARRQSGEVIEAVRAFATLMSSIQRATREQALGVRQLNEALSRIDRFTQQNAALVDGSGVTAAQLLRQSELLLRTVGRFKLGDEGPDGPR